MNDALSESLLVSSIKSGPGSRHIGEMLAQLRARSENERLLPSTETNQPPSVAEISAGEQRRMADVLHVGCGVKDPGKLPTVFRETGWRELRLDIDPEVRPDFVASITDMRVITDGAVDAVYSSHNIEHLYPHEVPLALREIYRILTPKGFAFIKLPDLQEVARYVAEGKLEDPLYISPMGPIAPLDILYGHRLSLAHGNSFMAHRTGFTGETLGTALINAGFVAVLVQRTPSAFCLDAVAFRNKPSEEQVAMVQARMLSAPDRPAVLYSLAD
jgi:SAM-dependent methyltransferase